MGLRGWGEGGRVSAGDREGQQGEGGGGSSKLGGGARVALQ